MSATKSPQASETSFTHDLLYALRYYLGSRRGMIALGLVTVAAGAAFNWDWLVAIGAAPVILALAPCAAMCALGLCMYKMMGRSCATDTTPQKSADATNDQVTPGGRDAVPESAPAASLQPQPLEQRSSSDT
jgi:hypothetical protein